MKILFIADQHVLLRKKYVPKEWLANRIKMFHSELANNVIPKHNIDLIILGGDLFDKAPSIAEVGLFLDFLNMCKVLNVPVVMIAGNHEATTKYDTFLKELCILENDMFKLILDQQRINFDDVNITFMSYAEVKRETKPLAPASGTKNIAVSHICGELPPHIKEEYPISNFDGYDLVLLGDLHHYHKSLTGKNAWYPGSPYSITFAQNAGDKDKYGVFLIDTGRKTEWEIPTFIPISLPQLITRKCSSTEIESTREQIKDSMHCYKIEVEGTPEELSKIKDKDISKKSIVYSEATVALSNMTRDQELQTVLEYMDVSNIEGVMALNATIKNQDR